MRPLLLPPRKLLTRRKALIAAAAAGVIHSTPALTAILPLTGAGSLPFHRTPAIDIITSLGLTTDLELCLDAGDSASYTSGQSWLDRSGNGYDFFRGTDGSAGADDPTFNGVAGGLSEDEFWGFDGGDYFTYDAANETWMENLHKDNAVGTIATWVYLQGGANTTLCGTNAANAFNIGFAFQTRNAAVTTRLNVTHGLGNSINIQPSQQHNTNAWNFCAFAIDEAIGTNGLTLQVNGVQELVTSTYTTPNSASASFPMQIAAAGNAVQPVQSGDRMAMLMAWSRRLSTGELMSVYQATRGRLLV